MTTKTPDPIVGAGRRESMWRLVVMAAAIAGVMSVGTASPAVAADTCANAVVRAQNSSVALPDCRGYEMVSSPYKEGFIVEPEVNLRFTDNGVFSYGTTGTFAGNQLPAGLNRYHATRSAAGWVSSSISIPGWIYDTYGNTADRESADLSSSLWAVIRRQGVPDDKGGWYLRGPDGTVTRVGDRETAGRVLLVAGETPDLLHTVYSQVTSPLFEHVGTGNGVPRTVSVDNHGQMQSPVCMNRISLDGRVIVYSTQCAGGTPTGMPQVWARIGGAVTVAVSGSECTRAAGDPGGTCNSVSAATYAGGAVDGSRVFLTTRQQLVNGDIDAASSSDPYAGNDLYACDVPAGVPSPAGAANSCGSLTEVSGAASNARVENVVAVSEDGSRVYFVAQGVLASNPGAGQTGLGNPQPGETVASAGAHNLYVWERDRANPAGTTRFVAGLSAGNDLAGAQLTPDGRYLLFLTASGLVSAGPGADTDGRVDAYRYDAITKALVRVSVPVSGSGGNLGFDVSLVQRAPAMSADGSAVIFDTDEALSVTDTDGVTDVYAWGADTGVSQISVGGGRSMGITPSGRDIFFATDVQLLSVDRDALTDIYDARVGGGFALAQTTPCSGTECQGPRSQPPALAGPSPAGSGTGSPGASELSPVFSLRAVSAAQRRALAAMGKVSLTVTSNAAGTISAKATTTTGGRTVAAGSGRRALIAPGTATVTLALSKKARSRLAARGKLTVRVSVSHSKVALDRAVTLKLVKLTPKRSASRAHGQRLAGVSGGR